MSFDRGQLVALAGVDPWALHDKLSAGDPAQIETLATAFYRAGGDLADARTSTATAQRYVNEGYTVNGSSPVDFDAQARSTRDTPEQLDAIAKTLGGVATDLDQQTGKASTEVNALQTRLAGLESAYEHDMQTFGHHLPTDDQESIRQGYLNEAVTAVKTSGSTVDSIVTDYEITLMGATKRMADLGYVAPPALDKGPDPLAAVIDNANGEKNGGPVTTLTTNLADLTRLLNAARADGYLPSQYAALLDQYWAVKSATAAGIDLNNWDPQAGVGPNQQNILAVYKYYGQLFLNNPNLQWAGMANMIGPSFAGGFMDLDEFRKIAAAVRDKINSLPGPVRAALPPEVSELAGLANISSGEFSWYENKFLAMQKHIFLDQGAMHQAYVDGGTGAIDEMQAAGLVDGNADTAWHNIDSGDPTLVQQGNTALLSREQNQIITNQYDQMYHHDGPVGAVMTYGMTAVGSASIPNTHTPGQYSPLTIGADVDVPSPIPFVHETVGVHVSTPLPNFNIANRDSRWDYITHDTLPAYQQLLRDHPDEVRQIVSSSVSDRVAEQRLASRWPQLAYDLTHDWSVSADAGVHLGW